MNSMSSFPRAGDKRNFGYSAAHEADPLPLLPSGPGGVRGESLHRARSSTDRRSASQFFLRCDRFAESSIPVCTAKEDGLFGNSRVSRRVMRDQRLRIARRRSSLASPWPRILSLSELSGTSCFFFPRRVMKARIRSSRILAAIPLRFTEGKRA